MNRIRIERHSARVWLFAPEDARTSLTCSDAECLADMAGRMVGTTSATDVRVGGVGLRRTSAATEVSIHQETATSAHRISTFDVGSLARMLREAATSRIFQGSIGILDAPTDSAAQAIAANAPELDFTARSPAPEFSPGGDLAAFQVDDAPRRGRQVDACLPRPTHDTEGLGVPTVDWDDFVTPELKIADVLPSRIYAAIQPFWRAFDAGRWMGIEWVHNYAGQDVWRSTERSVAVTSRQEVSVDTMVDMERYGLVAADDARLRVATQSTYDLWRAVQLAGGMYHRDERMSTPVPLPIGFEAPGIEALSDFETCIVEFSEDGVRIHPYAIVEGARLNALADDLRRMGIVDSRRAEIATRIGRWLYPERDTYYGGTLANHLGGRGASPRLRDRIGWDDHFVMLTRLPHWQMRALDRYSRSIKARTLPVAMPTVQRPDDWQSDPLLLSGAEQRIRRMGRRSRVG